MNEIPSGVSCFNFGSSREKAVQKALHMGQPGARSALLTYWPRHGVHLISMFMQLHSRSCRLDQQQYNSIRYVQLLIYDSELGALRNVAYIHPMYANPFAYNTP